MKEQKQMYCEIEFGKHKGRSYEWIFFNDPSYATWLYENSVVRARTDLDPFEKDYFDELYARASGLVGVCDKCNEKPIAKKMIYCDGGMFGAHLFCEECKIPRLRKKYYSSLSMLDFGLCASKHQASVFYALADQYTGFEGEYSQEEKEAFFRNDANFTKAVPGFFADWEREVDRP